MSESDPFLLTIENGALKARADKAEADLTALVAACRTLVELPWWLERLHDKINRRQALADLYMQELSGLRNWSEKVTALLARAEGGVRRPPQQEETKDDQSRVDSVPKRPDGDLSRPVTE